MGWLVGAIVVLFFAAREGLSTSDAAAKADADAKAKAKADADAKAKADADERMKAEAEAKAKADADAKAKAAEAKKACEFECGRLDATPFTFQTVYKPLNGKMIGPTIRMLIANEKAEKKDFDFWHIVLRSEYDERKKKFMPTPAMVDIGKLAYCIRMHADERFKGA